MRKSLRFSLFSTLLLFFGTAMAQTTVTIDFDNDYATLFPTLAGVSSSTGDTAHDGDFTEATTSTPVDGVTVTVSAKDAGVNSDNRIWNSNPRLRMYSGTFTVSGPDITQIVFTGHSTNFNISAETGTLTDRTWVGQADEVVFKVAKNTQLDKIEVTLGGEVINPDDLPKVLYTEAFTSNMGQFTIDNINMPEQLSYIWTFNNYGAVASAYVSNTGYDAESWLISPAIDLSQATGVELSFTHALNKFLTIDDAKSQAKVLYRIGQATTGDVLIPGMSSWSEWQELPGVVYPTELGWTFVENTLDLSSLFDGKMVQVAFKFVSTDESAGTWEIKPFTIKGKGEATIVASAIPEAAVIVNGISELLALGQKTQDIRLNFGEGTQVLFVTGSNIFVRDNQAAVCFYNTKLSLKANQLLSGSVRGDLAYYGNADKLQMAELTGNNYTTDADITATDGEAAVAKAATLADVVAGKYTCDLVELTNVVARVDSTSGQNVYYLEDGDLKATTSNLQNLRNYLDKEIKVQVVVGMQSSGEVRLYPVNAIEDLSGIAQIAANAAKKGQVYNLAGQRVSEAKSGLFIRDGRKYVVR